MAAGYRKVLTGINSLITDVGRVSEGIGILSHLKYGFHA